MKKDSHPEACPKLGREPHSQRREQITDPNTRPLSAARAPPWRTERSRLVEAHAGHQLGSL
eukprot:2650017-Pyramimonas_sp.AAC.1